MEQTPEPISAGRAMLKVSRRKRILIGALLVAGSFLAVALERWTLGGGRGIYWIEVPVAVYVLLLVVHPEWVARMDQKQVEKLKNWRPNAG